MREAETMQEVLDVLMATDDPPCHYGLTVDDLRAIAAYFDWETQWVEDKADFPDLAALVASRPKDFLTDISRYYGDDYYLD
jgi:hypothetical protein